MKHPKFWSVALLLAALIALLVTSVANAASKDGPVVSLSVTQSDFASDEDVLVTVTIFNPTRHSVRILKWFTPADGVEEALFSVSLDGQKVGYVGPIYKRPAVTGKDYISLKAGESLVQTVNLGEYYDLSASGEYEIAYDVSSFNLYNEKGNAFKQKDSLRSEAISAKVVGRKKPPPPPPPPDGGTSFSSCTTDQQTTLLAARDAASGLAANSESYLLAETQDSRYETWFGEYQSARYTTVKTHFTAISDAMDNAGVTFDCKCKQPYFAYVYPNQPYKIYLCKVFWQVSLTGTDSQAGTLIHEMSHFDVVAATDDYVYGQTGAMELAITNPDNAVNNADNHEYFAENTPFKP
jgi:peptidyl-Lys metalloendopeptidase